MAEGEEAGAAEAREKGIKEGGCEEEAEGLGDEDEGYEGVGDVVVSAAS